MIDLGQKQLGVIMDEREMVEVLDMIAKHGMAREVCVNIFMAGNDAARVAVVAMAEYIGSVPLANDVDREQALAVGTASLASALTRHAESIVTMLTPSGSA